MTDQTKQKITEFVEEEYDQNRGKLWIRLDNGKFVAPEYVVKELLSESLHRAITFGLELAKEAEGRAMTWEPTKKEIKCKCGAVIYIEGEQDIFGAGKRAALTAKNAAIQELIEATRV